MSPLCREEIVSSRPPLVEVAPGDIAIEAEPAGRRPQLLDDRLWRGAVGLHRPELCSITLQAHKQEMAAITRPLRPLITVRGIVSQQPLTRSVRGHDPATPLLQGALRCLATTGLRLSRAARVGDPLAIR